MTRWKRYEVVVTLLLDAPSAEDASRIAEELIVYDPSHDENALDFIVSNAMEIDQ